MIVLWSVDSNVKWLDKQWSDGKNSDEEMERREGDQFGYWEGKDGLNLLLTTTNINRTRPFITIKPIHMINTLDSTSFRELSYRTVWTLQTCGDLENTVFSQDTVDWRGILINYFEHRETVPIPLSSVVLSGRCNGRLPPIIYAFTVTHHAR